MQEQPQPQPAAPQPTPVEQPPTLESVVQPDQGVTADSPPAPVFSWQASEFVAHDKGSMWYLGLVAVAAVLAAVFALTGQYLGIVVVVVMLLAVVVVGRRQPRILLYMVDDHGVSIDGELQPYQNFRSYSIIQDVAWQSIDFEPTKRFMPRLLILCEPEALAQAEIILQQHLPRQDRELDWIERASRYLRF